MLISNNIDFIMIFVEVRIKPHENPYKPKEKVELPTIVICSPWFIDHLTVTEILIAYMRSELALALLVLRGILAMKEQSAYAHSISWMNYKCIAKCMDFCHSLLAVLRTQVDVAEPFSFLGIHRWPKQV